ncbi:hypothetical protein GIB67_033728 [Kingdonia uniflora]|uniref:Uncharacterized protein n=1 Tax=Kingdonia uniflora TaxID=39325 RepID=A0A7J7P420_9MAGN|nr:hypothetical protein GIB67_033728 [Kingdonia uniflora]
MSMVSCLSFSYINRANILFLLLLHHLQCLWFLVSVFHMSALHHVLDYTWRYCLPSCLHICAKFYDTIDKLLHQLHNFVNYSHSLFFNCIKSIRIIYCSPACLFVD